MPLTMGEFDKLTSEADEAQRKAALTACVAEQVRAGRSAEDARRVCEEMLREKTGVLPVGGV